MDSTKFRRVVISIGCAIVLASAGALRAEVVVKVDGEPISREFVTRVSVLSGFGPGGLEGKDRGKVIQKAVTNRLMYKKVLKSKPDLAREVEESVDLMLARDYFRPYHDQVAMVKAQKEITVEKLLKDEIPQLKEAVDLYQIVFADKATAEEIREKIVKGEIGFEDAAKKYSKGISGPRGGSVGGIEPDNDRYTPAQREVIFAAKKGEVTQLVDTMFGPSIFWIKDRKSTAERREIAAKEMLKNRIAARAMQIVAEDADDWATKNDMAIVMDKDAVGKDKVDFSSPAFRHGKRVFTITQVLDAVGGDNHGSKEVLGIIEGRMRDYATMGAYKLLKGDLEGAEERRQAVIEHTVSRRYIDRVANELTISDEEISKYVEDHLSEFYAPEVIGVGMIQVKTQERAEVVAERIAAGVPFAEVATAWSLHDTKKTGGDLGLLALSQIPDDFKIIKTLKVGETSPIVHIKEGETAGYYIFKVTDHKMGRQLRAKDLNDTGKGVVRGKLIAQKREDAIKGIFADIGKGVKVQLQ